MRDALELAEAIGRIESNTGKAVPEQVDVYRQGMMLRGVEAVQKSRGVAREDRGVNEPWMIWGHAARPSPEETVKIAEWLR